MGEPQARTQGPAADHAPVQPGGRGRGTASCGRVCGHEEPADTWGARRGGRREGGREAARAGGHILGSSIVELWLDDGQHQRKLVFSGDLGRSGMPVLRDPSAVADADLVLMESTYGDRLHRAWSETVEELREVFEETFERARGNVLVPAFAVGRTQEILYLFARYYDAWGLDRWQIFLDSPLAIEATRVYARHAELFDHEARQMWRRHEHSSLLPNLKFTEQAEESMQLNRIVSGAVIIAGSGMCTGGRIKHHLKHNVWRRGCQVLITGYQARGTPGRAMVDGARHIRLWGETVRVNARVHTVGGLSAHADQAALSAWYRGFENRPPLLLVHGEPPAQQALVAALRSGRVGPVRIARRGECLDLCRPLPPEDTSESRPAAR